MVPTVLPMNPPVSLVCLYPLPFIIFLLETPSPDSLLRRYIFQIYFNYFSLQLCLQVEFLFFPKHMDDDVLPGLATEEGIDLLSEPI